MPKVFRNMPKELEQYNPKDEFSFLTEQATFDEKGRYHSYNDQPSLVEFVQLDDGVKKIYWHSHGVLHREGNKPPYICIDKSSYITHDANKEVRSFGDLPSVIFYNRYTEDHTVSWNISEVLHREGNPAEICVNKFGVRTETWYEKGIIHRGDGLPAIIDPLKNEWFVKGFRHNENGYSYRYEPTSDVKSYFEWNLYDIEISEKSFVTLKAFQKEKDVPLWLAFLHEFKIIEDSQVDFFLKEDCYENLPLDWALRSLGVTDKVFNHKLVEFQPLQFNVGENHLKALIEIAEFDKSRMNLS
jgi:hypothetical protein